jgi:PEP-CTERM motif
MKGINVLGWGATFAAVAGAITLSSSSAQALNLVVGDRLYGDANFKILGDARTSLQFDFYNASGQAGTSGGVFTVDTDLSTDAFDPYNELVIKDVTFNKNNSIDLSGFLSYDDGANGLDDFYIDWNDVVIGNDIIIGNQRFIDITGSAVFTSKNGEIYSGVGSATSLSKAKGKLTVDLGTGKAIFDYTVDKAESVPEPASVLGLLAVGALGAGSLKRKKSS